MPKYRQLHTKIVDSFDFAEMPDDFTRVLWLLLIVIVDSEGRGIDSPSWIRARMFPLRPDVDLDHIEAAMAWLANRSMIIRYEVDNRRYFCIPTFKSYQSGTEKEARSTLPPTPDLLQTYSRPTPEKVSVNTIQYNADSISSQIPAVDGVSGEIYRKFENEICMLTPGLAAKIGDWIDDYPADWIKDAIDAAVNANVRKPNYIAKVLQNWKSDGRNGTKPEKAWIPEEHASEVY